MCQENVPRTHECFQRRFEIAWGTEGFSEYFASHDAKPNFDLVEPGAVEGGEVDNDPIVISLQPLHAFNLGIQLLFRRAPNPAELSHELTEKKTAMGREIVHHVVNGLRCGESSRMTFENVDERFSRVIGSALDGDLPIGVIQEGEYVQCPIADIFEFFEALFHGVGLQIGHQAREDLNAGTLVKEEQVVRWVSVEREEVLHFWEEVGIRDVKEVARLVRLQAITLQNAMQGGLAGSGIHFVRLCLQVSRGPSQRPSPTSRQRLGLTVKPHNSQLGFFRIDGRPS